MPWRTRYRSWWPESFSQPAGLGSSARARIRATTRCRAFLFGRASSSLAADSLMRTLYLATLPQVLDHTLEVEARFGRTRLEGCPGGRVCRQALGGPGG